MYVNACKYLRYSCDTQGRLPPFLLTTRLTTAVQHPKAVTPLTPWGTMWLDKRFDISTTVREDTVEYVRQRDSSAGDRLCGRARGIGLR